MCVLVREPTTYKYIKYSNCMRLIRGVCVCVVLGNGICQNLEDVNAYERGRVMEGWLAQQSSDHRIISCQRGCNRARQAENLFILNFFKKKWHHGVVVRSEDEWREEWMEGVVDLEQRLEHTTKSSSVGSRKRSSDELNMAHNHFFHLCALFI